MDQLLQPAPVAPITPPSALPAKSNKMLLWISGLVILAVIAGAAIMYWGRTGLFKGTIPPPSCGSLDSIHCEYGRPDCRWVIDYDGEGSDICQTLSGVTPPAEAPGEPPPPPPPACSSYYNERTLCEARSDCSWSFDTMSCSERSPVSTTEPVVPLPPCNSLDETQCSTRTVDCSWNIPASDPDASLSCINRGSEVGAASTPTSFILENDGEKNVIRGSSVSASITARLLSGPPQSIPLAVDGLPLGATSDFPASCLLPCTTILTINTFADTPTGRYSIRVFSLASLASPRSIITMFDLIVNRTAEEEAASAASPPAFDFTIENVTDQLVEPINPTKIVVITVNQVSESGSPQPVSFSTSGFPTGVTTRFSSPSCTPNPTCTTNLTITGSASASVGDHTVSVSGISGTMPSRNASFHLIVESGSWAPAAPAPAPSESEIAPGSSGEAPAAPAPSESEIAPGSSGEAPAASMFNFNLSNDGPKIVARGGMTSEIISVNLVGGVTQPVTFAVGGLPPGASVTFSPTSCSPTCRTTLTVRTNADTPSGDHNLIVTATAGGETRRTNFALSVTNPSSWAPAAPLSGADSLNSEIASLRQQLADSLRNRDVGVTSSLMSQISALQSQINDMRNQPVVVNIPGTTTSASSRIVVTNTAPTAPVPTPNANVSGTVAISANTPSSSQASAAARTRGAFIRGQTGPEMLLYPFLIALANGAYFLIKKRKWIKQNS